MSASVKVLADSTQHHGHRLTTLEVTLPRVVLSEFNTHRAFSRNSASSRAIPVAKMLQAVETDPYIPTVFSLNDKGMAAKQFVRPIDDGWDDCVEWWLNARNNALNSAEDGIKLGLHKQVVNRILEPWMRQTIIVSATEWDNFFDLRTAVDEDGNPLADIAIYEPAVAMKEAMDKSIPQRLLIDQWHVPLTGFEGDEELSTKDLVRVSVARCARVSYLTHEGKRDVQADLDLFERLKKNKHASPFEHAAKPFGYYCQRNFIGWLQARVLVEEGSL